jgi:hypothetical protein
MSTAPVSHLATLLASMQPELRPGTWAWCTLPPDTSLADVDAVATVREAEGLSVVVDEAVARAADALAALHALQARSA